MNLRRIATTAVAAAAVVVMTAGAATAAPADTVHPDRVGEDWSTADTRTPGTLEFDSIYGGARGDGAAVLSTPTDAAKVQLFTDEFDRTRLADIEAIEYATYIDTAATGSPAAPAINIRLDTDKDDNADAYLVYEPYQDLGNPAVLHDVWQTWDALRGGDALWWSGQLAACPQRNPCTWSEILTAYPDATIREDGVFEGSLGINQGSYNAGLLAAADALRIATADGTDVTYDFEPHVTLTGKSDCKNGGWARSTDPVFRNQGGCVSHFARR